MPPLSRPIVPTRLPRAARGLALLGALLALGSAQAFDLTVQVLNTKADKGPVLGALYGPAASWLKFDQVLQTAMAPVDGEKAVLVLRNLPAGPYALSLFQDENGNGKMDSNPFGMPLERYGFSRDAQGRMGPPSYADAAIELQADTTITIQLR